MLSEKQQTDPDYTERYNAYRIRRCINRFLIFDDRSKSPAICEARDVMAAKKWIDAYGAGEQWAITKRTKYKGTQTRGTYKLRDNGRLYNLSGLGRHLPRAGHQLASETIASADVSLGQRRYSLRLLGTLHKQTSNVGLARCCAMRDSSVGAGSRHKFAPSD